MAQIRIAASPAFELRAPPPFADATLIPPPSQSSEPPHSFSYLLSMQDMARHSSDSPACLSISDHDLDFPEFSSSPCSAIDQDQSLVETISEDDRATLLPIIRIAFPSLRYSMKYSPTPWYIAGDGRIMETLLESRQTNTADDLHRFERPNEGEGLRQQPMDCGVSTQENEAEVLQSHFLPAAPSLLEELSPPANVSGVQSAEELKHQLVRKARAGVYEVEKQEVSQEFMSFQGAGHRSIEKDDKLYLPKARSHGELNLLTSFSSATNSSDHMEPEASGTNLVQLQVARPVNNTSPLCHAENLAGGPSSIDNGSPHLETSCSKCGEVTEQSHIGQFLGVSRGGQNPNESEHVFTSMAVKGPTLVDGLDLAAVGSSRNNVDQTDSVSELRCASPAVSSGEHQFKFTEVNRRKRSVIKKAVGWVKKAKTSESFCSMSSYECACTSPCLTSCEAVSKKRISPNTPNEVSLSKLVSAF